MDALTDKIDLFNEKYWIFVLFLLVGAGLYFCVRTVVVQLRYIPDMFKAVAEPPSELESGQKGISAFKAFTISAASRVGTGNVAGVALAIATGGPGAVFWMWTLAIIGGATSFVESTLAQVYKVRDKDSYRVHGADHFRWCTAHCHRDPGDRADHGRGLHCGGADRGGAEHSTRSWHDRDHCGACIWH